LIGGEMGRLDELDDALKQYLDEFWRLSGGVVGQEGLSKAGELVGLESFRGAEESFWGLPVEVLTEVFSELSTMGFPLKELYEYRETKLELEVLRARVGLDNLRAVVEVVRPYMESNPRMTFREAIRLLERDRLRTREEEGHE
jgi:hypothetical protein